MKKIKIFTLLSGMLLSCNVDLMATEKNFSMNIDKVLYIQQQSRIVTGKISDALDGTPVIGANIIIKGSQRGVITNLDGKYSIQVNSEKDMLVVSFVGYKTREIPVENLGVIDISLEPDNEVLDEVVVVGAGTQRKVSVTGSISSIKGASLKTPSASLSNGLAGRLAGVIVNTSSGEPGSGSDFYIRGISTFGGVRTPLILLDDVEISTGDLNNIPAETIESFTVLKDASATAIYGARGANGVMLITTKRGTENSKAKIRITAENSFNIMTNYPDFVDGATWMELYNEAQITRNPSAGKFYDDERIQNTRDGINPYLYPDVDWNDLMFKNMAMNQRVNVNVSGGASRVTYYMSLNVNHDTGLLNSPKIYSWNNNINRMAYNFQNNISYKLTSSTKVDLNMNAQLLNGKGPKGSTSSLFREALATNPVAFPATYPSQESYDHVIFGNAYRNTGALYANPYADMVSTFKQTDASTINVALKINQGLDFITKGFSANALINFKSWSQTSYDRTMNPYFYQANDYDEGSGLYELEALNSDGTDYYTESATTRNSNRTIAMQFQLNYQRQFGLHNVGGMLMYMQRDYKAGNLPNRNQGFSGRLTYDYGQRYLAEFNFGYNGTERLPEGRRFEFFPALSLGWVISNEDFFKPLSDKIDNLKLRASYGLVGSDQFNSSAEHFLYRQIVDLDAISFVYGDDWLTSNGPSITGYPVIDPCWERSRKLDIGIDLVMFKNLSITADFFHENRSRILMERASWPYYLGYLNVKPWSNVGKVKNWGGEVSVNYRQQINKDWTVDFRGNFVYARNKYIYKDEPYREYSWLVETGTPLGATWGYIADGLFTSEQEIADHAEQTFGSEPKPGDIKYRDLNGDNKIDYQDKCMISEYGDNPRIQYGFGLNINYKKFDLGVFFNGSAMRTIMIGDIHPFLKDPTRGDRNVFQFIADDYWSEENQNPNAAYPRLGLTADQVKNNHEASTYWMRNGNFLRFKTLELGYTFKYGRVFLNGDNLAVFSPFKLWDPELAWNSYPLQRTITVGFQLNF